MKKDGDRPESKAQVRPVKRFVAGAVCPRCGELDRIVAFNDSFNQQRKECVSCGFNEGLDENALPSELETRATKQRKPQLKAQPLRFYPSPSGKSEK